MKKPVENKKLAPPSNKSNVWVKILPDQSIENVGKDGDVVELPREVAEQYKRDGYVEILEEEV